MCLHISNPLELFSLQCVLGLPTYPPYRCSTVHIFTCWTTFYYFHFLVVVNRISICVYGKPLCVRELQRLWRKYQRTLRQINTSGKWESWSWDLKSGRAAPAPHQVQNSGEQALAPCPVVHMHTYGEITREQ